ncbi:uncharacterized protein [Palaemon carinicauda]|uniref:uncharacterized protein isoform X1 n=1 Tax=Palaemon carinicauda TaxID=392227 RepID=UPI0035B68621
MLSKSCSIFGYAFSVYALFNSSSVHSIIYRLLVYSFIRGDQSKQVELHNMNAKAVTILLIVFVLHTGHCQYCHTGIQGATIEFPCPSEICLKHVTTYDDSQAIIYSCSQQTHEVGCRRDVAPFGYMENCYCKGNLCNSSGNTALTIYLLLGCFFLNIFL